MKRFFIKMGTICTSLVISVIGPTHAYFAHGIRTTWTSDRIPLTAPHSDVEFMINVLLQTIIVGHGALAYFALEVAMSLIENVVIVTPHLSTSDLAHTIRLYKDKAISEMELRCRINNFVTSTHDTDK